MIAPALGVMKMAYMRITLLADHFEYMPMAGLIALAVAGTASAVERPGARVSKYIFGAAAGCVVILFGVLTWQRGDVFHDPESLWVDTLLPKIRTRGRRTSIWAGFCWTAVISRRRFCISSAAWSCGPISERPITTTETSSGTSGWTRPWLWPKTRRLWNWQGKTSRCGSAMRRRWSRRGVPQEAIEQYKIVLLTNLANALICCKVGELLSMQTGKTSGAVDYYQRGLAIGMPDLQPAQSGPCCRGAAARKGREEVKSKSKPWYRVLYIQVLIAVAAALNEALARQKSILDIADGTI